MNIIKEAINSVPALRYVLSVGAVLVVVVVILSMKVDPRAAILGSVIVLGLMVGLFLFSYLAKNGAADIRTPALALMWGW